MNKKYMWGIIILIILALSVFLIFLKDSNVFNKENITTANTYLQNKEYDKAERIYLKFLKNKNEQYENALYGLAKIKYMDEQYENAATYFKMIIDTVPGFQIDAYIYLALIAEKQDEYDLAIEYITRADEIIHEDLPEDNLFFGNIPLIMSRCYLQKGDVLQAKKYIEDYLTKVENLEEKITLKAYQQLASILIYEGNYREAKNYYLKSNYKIENAQNRIGEISPLYGLISTELALKEYSEIIKLSKDIKLDNLNFTNKNELVSSLYGVGMSEIKNNDFNSAKEKFNRILTGTRIDLKIDNFNDFYSYSLLAYYGLATSDLLEKRYNSAKESFVKMIEITEQIPSSRYEYFIQKANVNFFKLLAYYGNAEAEYFTNNLEAAKQNINKANQIINTLDSKEKLYIQTREIGNNGSIINKVNNLNLKLNKDNEES